MPDDPALMALIDLWPTFDKTNLKALKWKWLYAYEALLREHYPEASARQISVTTRLAAPFSVHWDEL